MPDVFGAAGRMEDYWGPPSFAWPDTGLFIAQNMGQLYIGAIPLLLLLTAAVRGQLWAPRDPLLHLSRPPWRCSMRSAGTRRFSASSTRCCPASSLYRRPADATFLVGALAAILAGYGAHRLFREPPAAIVRAAWRSSRPRAGGGRRALRSRWASGSAACRGCLLPLGAAAALVCGGGAGARLGEAAASRVSRCWPPPSSPP